MGCTTLRMFNALRNCQCFPERTTFLSPATQERPVLTHALYFESVLCNLYVDTIVREAFLLWLTSF